MGCDFVSRSPTPEKTIAASNGEPIAILNHNKPTAYLIPAKTYEELLENIEDYQLNTRCWEHYPFLPDTNFSLIIPDF